MSVNECQSEIAYNYLLIIINKGKGRKIVIFGN